MSEDLHGWVVLVAGEAAPLVEVARLAVAAGAEVGVVSMRLPDDAPATVRFRADPVDPHTWPRIAMHIEQHLGPIDGVVTDTATRDTAQVVFGADLSRRGRSPVYAVGPSEPAEQVVTALFRRPPAAPSPPASAAPDP